MGFCITRLLYYSFILLFHNLNTLLFYQIHLNSIRLCLNCPSVMWEYYLCSFFTYSYLFFSWPNKCDKNFLTTWLVQKKFQRFSMTRLILSVIRDLATQCWFYFAVDLFSSSCHRLIFIMFWRLCSDHNLLSYYMTY